MVNDLTLILLTWRKWLTPNNASKWQIGFNSAFKGLNGFFNRSIIVKRQFMHKQAARLRNKHTDNCIVTFTFTCPKEQDTAFRHEK